VQCTQPGELAVPAERAAPEVFRGVSGYGSEEGDRDKPASAEETVYEKGAREQGYKQESRE
jgi:hypothetical protein